jgi:hypothetical protein
VNIALAVDLCQGPAVQACTGLNRTVVPGSVALVIPRSMQSACLLYRQTCSFVF